VLEKGHNASQLLVDKHDLHTFAVLVENLLMLKMCVAVVVITLWHAVFPLGDPRLD